MLIFKLHLKPFACIQCGPVFLHWRINIYGLCGLSPSRGWQLELDKFRVEVMCKLKSMLVAFLKKLLWERIQGHLMACLVQEVLFGLGICETAPVSLEASACALWGIVRALKTTPLRLSNSFRLPSLRESHGCPGSRCHMLPVVPSRVQVPVSHLLGHYLG